MTHVHVEPNGSIYCWIEIRGRSFGATYAPGTFDGMTSAEVRDLIAKDILTVIRAEYARNPNSFR